MPDTRNILGQFDEIEKKLEKLMGVLKSLEESNLDLKNTNERLKEELQKKIESESSYIREREVIRSKIDGILMKLEDISEASR
ncbi:MAG: hypothetical protein A2V65_04680 [Deltaproteobacteria bacterium RBG_13_49_15]|nr:MAG: hypothetical protein A2V65_04680 [Deltaproteobacteria bacterium RBG_13_49_15]